MNYRGPYRVRADRNKPFPEILHPNDAIKKRAMTSLTMKITYVHSKSCLLTKF